MSTDLVKLVETMKSESRPNLRIRRYGVDRFVLRGRIIAAQKYFKHLVLFLVFRLRDAGIDTSNAA